MEGELKIAKEWQVASGLRISPWTPARWDQLLAWAHRYDLSLKFEKSRRAADEGPKQPKLRKTKPDTAEEPTAEEPTAEELAFSAHVDGLVDAMQQRVIEHGGKVVAELNAVVFDLPEGGDPNSVTIEQTAEGLSRFFLSFAGSTTTLAATLAALG